MYATLAIRDVDCCLIPESQFYLEGPGGHMVIVIAEGAGQCKHTMDMDQQDASGNKLFQDADLCIYQKIKEHFARRQKMATNLKYIAGNRKMEQGGDKASVLNQSAKLLGSNRYQQKQNRGIIRDQIKQALNFEIFGWDFPPLFYCELI
ncbi:hypothetical protein Q3G72_004893 [Acer saccharum]|nr:hypothetical protein Q3G72_004893 [Acer saccharum]